MKIVEFDERGQKVETDSRSARRIGSGGPLSGKPGLVIRNRERVIATPNLVTRQRNQSRVASDIQLYMFQTGTIRTKTKYIKMNQSEDDFEIPIPWFLIKHPKGNVVIDGGNAIEVAIDKRAHWGDVVNTYDPIMDVRENCIDQCRSVGVEPEDVRYVLLSHMHLDHSGAIGRYPKAQHIVQRIEYDYAYNPDWFSTGAYIRADFDRPGIDWKFLGGEYTDNFDLYGDGCIRMIFTPGHSPGHQSFLITLPNSGSIMLTIDAAYTLDHWDNKALPGLLSSAVDAAHSVDKMHKIAEDTGALVVTGHDPDHWLSFQKAPNSFYD